MLENLNVDLTTLIINCKFFSKTYEYNSLEKEIEVWILAKEKINEIKTLKQEAENNKDELNNKMLEDLLEGDNKNVKLLTSLKYEKHSPLKDIAVIESKLIKLEITPEPIDRINNLVLSS